MIVWLALAPSLLGDQLVVQEARRALEAERPVQAREMIARAVAAGATGPTVDYLLADLALVEGRWTEALVRYRALLAVAPSAKLQEQAGLAALHAGQTTEARALLEKAAEAPTAGWRTWNALGVAADRRGDWESAGRAYAAAVAAAPGQAASWNNLGWSRMLQGRWSEAMNALRRAHALAPDQPRIAANLDLARSAVDGQLPQRRAGESGEAYAARLNDAGVLARLGGDPAKAAAAFAQALEVSDRWFAPAAANLASVDRAASPVSDKNAAPAQAR